ncbi:ATP-binding protein [Fischerella sp. PCC 9605]|uniref:ATP-binding protein n=1 Tax=Fischerella sp. PCC 9605 TaxID=1173024 RepID=UPI00047ADF1B|nr:ATP-binding protein [Fischerella sp. PCC 9605]
MTHPASKHGISKTSSGKGKLSFLSLSAWPFSHLGIGNKIYFGYAIAISIVVGGTAVGVIVGDRHYNSANQQRIVVRQERKQLNKLRNTALSFQPIPEFSPYLQNPKNFQQAKSAAIQRIAKVKQLLRQVNSSASTSSIKALKPLLGKYNGTLENFTQSLEITLRQIEPSTLNSRKVAKAKESLTDLTTSEIYTKTSTFLGELAIVIETAEQQEEKAEIALHQAQTLRMLIIVASMGLSTSIAWLMAVYTNRAIARPIQAVTDIAHKVVQESNFELQASATTSDELGKLATYLNQLIHHIKTLLAEQQETKISADAAKSKFLAHMSHELRTPLNGILGYAEILQRSQNLTKREQRGIEIIHQCGSHLLTLINDILDLSKIEANKLQLHPTDFHLPSFLQGIVEICRLQAEQKDIEFNYQPPDNLPSGITADKKRLRQVLINLVGNAIKFTDTGSVTLHVKVRKNQSSSHVYIHFAIEDTGIGISSQQLEKIFLPFEQLGDQKSQNEGRGLGLTISQKIVEIMGSYILVKSELGKGSVFEFEIECPIADYWTESSIITSTGKIIGYSGSRKQILIVDDSWENRSLIVNILETIGFTVIEATNGQEGLEKANQSQPDLIISDIAMPIMDGREMLSKVRDSAKLKDTIVILSSASIFDTDRNKSLAIGANDFLAKPVKIKELYRSLSKHLQLNWIYEKAETNQLNHPEKISKIQMIVPPESELIMLIEYAKKGQIKGIQQELEKLAKMDNQYQKFVAELDCLVKRFNIQKIRQFLHKNIKF